MQDRSAKAIKKTGAGAVLGGVFGAAAGYYLSGDVCPAGLSAMYENLTTYPPGVKKQVENAASIYARDIVQKYWPYKMIRLNEWNYVTPPPEGIYDMIQSSCIYVSRIAFDYAAETVKSPLLVCSTLLNPGTIIPQLCAMGTLIGISAALLSNYMDASAEFTEENNDEQVVDAAQQPAALAPVDDVLVSAEISQGAASNPHTLFASKSQMLVAIKGKTQEMRAELHGFRVSVRQAGTGDVAAEESVDGPRP